MCDFRGALACVGFAIGCTNGAPAPALQPDNTPPVAASDLEARLDTAICQLWVQCGAYEEQASCEARHPARTSWQGAQRLQDIANGVMQYEGSRAADCIQRIASATCSDTGLSPDAANVGLLLAECDLFVLGTVADGAACNHTAECSENSTCQPDPSGPSSGQCLAGTCTQFANRTCGTGTPPCPDHEKCLPGGVCGGAGAAGAHCDLDTDCGQGLVCTGNLDAYGPTGNGTCAPAPGSGDLCSASGECALGQTCVTTSLSDTYQPINHCLPDVDRGLSCSAPGDIQWVGACKADSVCDLVTHTCVAPASDPAPPTAPVCE